MKNTENQIRNCKLCGDYQKPNCHSIKVGDCEIILPMGIFASQIVLDTKIKKFKNFVGKKIKVTFKDKIKTVFQYVILHL